MVYGLWSMVSFAQLNFDYTEGKFLIKGKVVDIETKRAIPLANIKIRTTGKGISCDNEGNFSMYVLKSDTLRFSSAGYIAKSMHVYDMDSTKIYTLQIELIKDFIKLKDVTIYPFRDKDEFVDAFMDAKNVNKVVIPGIAAPKYSNVIPKAKLTNPISLLYEKTKKKRAANPDFKP